MDLFLDLEHTVFSKTAQKLNTVNTLSLHTHAQLSNRTTWIYQKSFSCRYIIQAKLGFARSPSHVGTY